MASNNVNSQADFNYITVVTNDTQINVTQPVTNVIEVVTLGPQGPQGSGGGGTPGGSDTQIQFNSGSIFAGSQFLTYNYASESLQQGSSIARGPYSHAEGDMTQTLGDSAHSEGYYTQAIGESSHAEGSYTQAIGHYSHAEGNNTLASGSYQHVSGRYNTHGDDTSLFIVGNGADNNNRSDAFKVRQSGSIILPVTSSNTPNWTGTQGEMMFGTDGSGRYVIWAYLGGAWRSGSLV